MRIRPDEGRAWSGEALHVKVVADAVPGAGVMKAVPGCESLQETVVVRVLEVELDDVMVDVLDGEIYLGAVHAHPLELQAGHRARSVLEECLIYPKPNLLAGIKHPLDQVVLEDLGDQILRHSQSPPPHVLELVYSFYMPSLRSLPADT